MCKTCKNRIMGTINPFFLVLCVSQNTKTEGDFLTENCQSSEFYRVSQYTWNPCECLKL